MKVMLLQDVYNLGRAGDVRQVADGYARNYLLPRAFAVPATVGVQKQAENVRIAGDKRREQENRDKAGTAELLDNLRIEFPVRAGEQGRLYGSVTHQMIADAIEDATGEMIDRRNVIAPPIRELGIVEVPIRLTADLIPSVTVVVYQEGESSDSQDDSVIGPDASEIPADRSLSDNDNLIEAEPVDETDSEDLDKILE
ncbi:MAG: 50S ribosomal protein L9 [Chloroflexi bacterium]|nr:50S ribosomal protein L9 [Chloroflexota bacterium]MBS60014.1 50S ribosomal protein L9 [Anaerolineaceae bacterium]MBS60790.1 50S ribosomal protein L9 [Anaerolineaceae bacterium]|tara:strand:- start:2361 stop:2954 length:594 start_codon:yes stop_codon:yes gene_type:complete